MVLLSNEKSLARTERGLVSRLSSSLTVEVEVKVFVFETSLFFNIME